MLLTRPTATQLTRRARPRLEHLEDRAVPALYQFTILPDVSALSLSGNVAVNPIEEQGPGSLTTRFGGAVLVDFDAGAERIAFLRDGTTVVAENSGRWAPLPGGASGTASANYGGRVSVFGLGAQAAVRDVVVTSFTPAPLPTLDFGGGIFVFPSTQRLEITRGAADYNVPGFAMGSFDAARQGAENAASEGLFVDLAPIDPKLEGLYLLYVPIQLDLSFDLGGILDARLSIRGAIIGLGVAVESAPRAGGPVQPALAYLATQDAVAAPVIPVAGSLDAADPFRLTPVDPAPTARTEPTPDNSARVQPAVADPFFADLFAGAW